MTKAMPPRRALRLIFIALGLTACTQGPDFAPDTGSVPAAWRAPQTTVAFESLQEWWRGFKDPELDHLVSLAIAGNLDIKRAEQRIIEARAQRTIAYSAELPSLSATSQLVHARVPPALLPIPGGTNLTVFDAGFDASWEIDLFGKTRRSEEESEATLEATEFDRRAVLVSLLGEVGQNYCALRAAQARLEVVRRSLLSEQDTLEVTRAKHDSGLGSELAVAESEAQLAMMSAQIPTFEASISRASHALATLVGAEPNAFLQELSVPGAMPPAPPRLPTALPADVIRNRPDIASAERKWASATARIGVAGAQRYPSLTLNPTVALAGGTLHQIFASGSTLIFASLGLSAPLYSHGKLDAAVVSAEANAEEARLSYRKVILTSLREVEDALVSYEAEQRRHAGLLRARSASQRALDRATSVYRAGLGDFLAVLDAQRSLYSAEDALAESDQQLAQQMVALYKALGAGWN